MAARNGQKIPPHRRANVPSQQSQKRKLRQQIPRWRRHFASSALWNCTSAEALKIDETPFYSTEIVAKNETWLKITANITCENGFYSSFLGCKIGEGKTIKENRIRLFNVYCFEGKSNFYQFYYKLPMKKGSRSVEFSVESEFEFNGTLENITIEELSK